MILRFFGEPQEDKRLRQMILISAVLHVLVIVWVLTSSSLSRSLQPRAVAYTVELVSPEKLGTNLPGGGKKSAAAMEPVSSMNTAAPPPSAKERSQPQVTIPEKSKSLPSSQRTEEKKIVKKEKPIEKPLVKPEPEKPKVAEKKPEPQQVKPNPEPQKTAKVNEPKPEVKTIAPKIETKKTEPKPSEPEKSSVKETEKKKPEPQKKKTELAPEKPETVTKKAEAKPEKSVTKQDDPPPSPKTEEKKVGEKPANTDEIAPDDRDKRIAAALARIKAQTQTRGGSTFSEEVKGSGPITKGGEFGEGGGGAVRGLEFLIYTQQLQRRVQENWIVAGKKPGLVASVSFMIQPDGDVQEVALTQSSGDRSFDQSVVRAIHKAAPFPSPPESYLQEFATQKIFMNFGGEGRVN